MRALSPPYFPEPAHLRTGSARPAHRLCRPELARREADDVAKCSGDEAHLHLVLAAPELRDCLAAMVAAIDRAPDRECAAAVLETARKLLARLEGA